MNLHSAVVRRQISDRKVVGSKLVNLKYRYRIIRGSFVNDLSILDIGISYINLVRYRNGS
jgi:hypothetical protein